MEQLTDQMILDNLVKANISIANSFIYTLPIILLVIAIFIGAKKDKLMVANTTRIKKIAVVGMVISLLFGCFFVATCPLKGRTIRVYEDKNNKYENEYNLFGLKILSITPIIAVPVAIIIAVALKIFLPK